MRPGSFSTSEALNVTQTRGCRPSHARPVRGYGPKNGCCRTQRWFRNYGQWNRATAANAVEEWYRAASSNALEERHRTSSANALEIS